MTAFPHHLSRRDFLKLAGAASGALFLSRCAPVYGTPSPPITTPGAQNMGRLIIPETMGVNVHFLGDRTDVGEVEAFINGGFGFLRVDLRWSRAEKTPGEYDFKKYLRYISQFTALGIRSLLIIDYGNPLYDGGGPPISDAARRGFAQYLDAASRAFTGKMVMWEIWNEPDQQGFWPNPDPVEYQRLLHLALETLRKNDPHASIVAPAISNLKDAGAIRFIDELGLRGSIQQLDGISVHPYRYRYPEESLPDFLHIRSLIDSYSPDKIIPILWGESGYNEKDVGEATQAVLAIRQYLFSLTLDAPYTNWYNWRDYESAAQSGLLYGMVRVDLQPKLAYQAVRTLASSLNGFEFLRCLPVADARDYLLLFYKNGRYALAAWTTTSPAHSIRIDLGYTSPKISGIFGEEQPEAERTYPEIFISASPLFLKFDMPSDPPPIVWKPLGSVQSLNLEKPEITLRILNTKDRPLPIRLKIQSDWVQGVTSLAATPGEAMYTLPVSMLQPAPPPSAAVIEISHQQANSPERGLIWLSPFTAKGSANPI